MQNPSLVYLYLYLAIADKEFSSEEAELIVEKLKRHPGFDGMDMTAFVREVYENFLRLPYDQVLVYLENYMEQLDLREAERNQVLKDLEEIMEADGIVRKEEVQAYQKICRYLRKTEPEPYKASSSDN